MFTPVFAGKTPFAYFFFAVMNFIWVPIIFFFYPETAGRSLEAVDLMFAKAYDEGKPVYRVAQHMPKMSAAEVEAEAERIGLIEASEDAKIHEAKVGGSDSNQKDIHEGSERERSGQPSPVPTPSADSGEQA